MKIYLFLIGFISWISFETFTDVQSEIHVVYEVSFKKFKDSKSNKNESARLVIDDYGSYYCWNSSYNLAKTRLSKDVSEYELMAYNVDPSFVVFQKEGKTQFFEYISNQIFTYTENTKLDWKIFEESKEILGYTCNKATLDYSGRSWTAWYSKQLPLSYGPYKFGDLPGLILEISSDDSIFNFKAKDIGKIENDSKFEMRNFFLDKNATTIVTDKKGLNDFRKSYDMLPAEEKIKLINSDKNGEFDLVMIDEFGVEKVYRQKSRPRNYIEIEY